MADLRKARHHGLALATTPPARRIAQALLAVVGWTMVSGIGYFIAGQGRWTFSESIYMALITVSTVGFAELPSLHEVSGARELTAVVILGGIATVAYFQSTLTAFLIDGSLGEARRRNRMKRQIDSLFGHVVIAGVGSTGRHVVADLMASKVPFVAIDRNRERLDRLVAEVGPILYVHGEATDDDVLAAAGVVRAGGVVAALNDDKANLFVTVSARSMNTSARIVARVIEPDSTQKMLRAGANATVSPNMIGGRRMAGEVVHHHVTAFLDELLGQREELRIDQVVIPAGSTSIGRPLSSIARASGLAVLGARATGEANFRYNPPDDHLLTEGTALVVLGRSDDIVGFRASLGRAQ